MGFHSELNDFNDPHDYLLWQGSSRSYLLSRVVDNGPVELFDVPGAGNFAVIQYLFRPIAPPTVVVTYQVFPSEGGAASNHVAIQELFEDPGFALGSEDVWTQVTTPDGGFPELTNFIQGETGNRSAVLGGATSRTDEIYTSNAMFISDGRRKLGTNSLTISGTCAVITEESADETYAYDNLEMEIRSADTGRVLLTLPVADNRNHGDTSKIHFNFNLNYFDFYGRNVYVTFRAHNDEIYATTFSLEQVEFDLVFNYKT